MIKLFPKVRETLNKLNKNYILAVVTSKDCSKNYEKN